MPRLIRPLLASAAALALIAAPVRAFADEPRLVNVLLGRTPTTNAVLPHGDGDSTAPQAVILNPSAATDGDTGYSPDAAVTTILAGAETGNPSDNNGYDAWQDVYLQYDLGEPRDISRIRLFHNGYPAASSTFKNVAVEASDTPDFAASTVIGGPADYRETRDSHYQPQVIEPPAGPVTARYVRVWQRGHFIENFNRAWSGYSNKVGFREIEVLATPKDGEEAPREEPRNLALGRTPYVYGLEPTNIAAISDGRLDGEPAVHNSLGRRWLQFEYRDPHALSKVVLALEPGTYRSITVDARPLASSAHGAVIYSRRDVEVGEEPIEIPVEDKGIMAGAVRFTVERDPSSPTRYREIEIWGTGAPDDGRAPEYSPPASEYTSLVWSDEFDADAVDEDKWNIIDGMANHGAIYTRSAVGIAKRGGESYLSISSRNHDTTRALVDAVGWDRYGDQELGDNVTWSSGRVETKNKFSFEHGRMAVRAKPNDSQGIWPAIWMLAQDETGHDEIDVLEYLGQNPWGAWTTNHYGVLGSTKGSDGHENISPIAWSQDFHVFEVEWSPERITWFIDGRRVFSSQKGKEVDGMHSRPMFPILETQVNGGWVGSVDPSKQETKQFSEFLIDWVRVYQKEDQPTVRFDDLDENGGETGYAMRPVSRTGGLRALSTGEAQDEDKDNFFYGGQPRYETSRLAVADGASGEQSLVYEVPAVKDVHLTTYYQTLEGRNDTLRGPGGDALAHGHSIREGADGAHDFTLMRSTDGELWEPVAMTTVENFVEPHPAYARTTFDARDLPEDTRFIKIVFPRPPAQDAIGAAALPAARSVSPTDIQLAKVTAVQRRGAEPEPTPPPSHDPHAPVPEPPAPSDPAQPAPPAPTPPPSDPAQPAPPAPTPPEGRRSDPPAPQAPRPPARTGADLARTGGDLALPLAIAAALIATGTALRRSARR
ncbi:family 16 glycosylhydrolase [Actinomyces sp. B33]|uniref:family 16 glycosylhydrolase n=1 Tax=Actinomyces sp. B33 TaxID=2942131 RepID=UPI00233FF2DB|nr:family 16 glycosylhydrolase [Actinomyces sp. B33]MDC4232444.1 family 16 glycosylhydrolase [Actinomyces sp. B33]